MVQTPLGAKHWFAHLIYHQVLLPFCILQSNTQRQKLVQIYKWNMPPLVGIAGSLSNINKENLSKRKGQLGQHFSIIHLFKGCVFKSFFRMYLLLEECRKSCRTKPFFPLLYHFQVIVGNRNILSLFTFFDQSSKNKQTKKPNMIVWKASLALKRNLSELFSSEATSGCHKTEF